MDHQIINGKKFPPFPFYGKSNNTDNIYKVVGIIEHDKFSATNGSYKGFLYRNDVTPVSITQITFDEQPAEKKYRPWTREDIGSLLFFKDKIFDSCGVHLSVTEYCSITNSVSFNSSDWPLPVKSLFNKYKYSTDGKNWLPCGVEI